MAENKKTALITGASSGIGRETAILLARDGFLVVAAARRMDRLRDLADKVGNIIPVETDLSRPESVESFCSYIEDLDNPPSVLVNNAGYSIRGALEDITQEMFRRIFEVNLFSLIKVTQACLPGMRKMRWGRIVNLSSIVGKFTFPMSGIYASTKHAVEAISDALRMEVQPFGIKVITIRPGPIATEFNDVATELTGDLMSRIDPDYKKVYETAGGGVGKLFTDVSIPGPDLIAGIIFEAITAKEPEPVYAAGPFVDEILEKRMELDDKSFNDLLTAKFGLKDLKV